MSQWTKIIEDKDKIIAAKDAELARLRDVVEAARDISECPITPDTATYNQGKGIDSAPPHQAVVMVHCSWTRWKALTASLRAIPSPAEAGARLKEIRPNGRMVYDYDEPAAPSAQAGEKVCSCSVEGPCMEHSYTTPAAPSDGAVSNLVRVASHIHAAEMEQCQQPKGSIGRAVCNARGCKCPPPAAPSDAKAGERP
jgi:hypothetical protein